MTAFNYNIWQKQRYDNNPTLWFEATELFKIALSIYGNENTGNIENNENGSESVVQNIIDTDSSTFSKLKDGRY